MAKQNQRKNQNSDYEQYKEKQVQQEIQEEKKLREARKKGPLQALGTQAKQAVGDVWQGVRRRATEAIKYPEKSGEVKEKQLERFEEKTGEDAGVVRKAATAISPAVGSQIKRTPRVKQQRERTERQEEQMLKRMREKEQEKLKGIREDVREGEMSKPQAVEQRLRQIYGGTFKRMAYAPEESEIYDPYENPEYQELSKKAQKEGVSTADVTKFGIDVGTGVLSTAPGIGADVRPGSKQLKRKPGYFLGRITGETALFGAAGKGLSSTIGRTGKLSRVAASPKYSRTVKGLAKVGEKGAAGTRGVLTSKPVRYASEGYTGEAVDLTQAYLAQSPQITSAIKQGDYKEAGARLAAGYGIEKIQDYSVGRGFRKGIPQKQARAPKEPDVETFISETGSPKTGRLFETKPEKPTAREKLEKYTTIDLKMPDTRVEPEVLKGTKFEGKPYGVELKPPKTKGVKAERPVRGEKTEKQEKQEKIEKIEKIEKAEKQEKQRIFEPMGLPIGMMKPARAGPKGYTGYESDIVSKSLKDIAEQKEKKAQEQARKMMNTGEGTVKKKTIPKRNYKRQPIDNTISPGMKQKPMNMNNMNNNQPVRNRQNMNKSSALEKAFTKHGKSNDELDKMFGSKTSAKKVKNKFL